MKIVRLQAENVKRLKAVDITPAGPLVEITGRNGQGKSSVLDSIWWALTGARNIQTVPIRKGAERAVIRLDLGDIVVERRFNEKGTTVTVESGEGARYNSPQAMLDKLVGSIAFDPLEFTRMDARKQYDALRAVSKVEVDFDKLRGLNARDGERRRDLKRDAAAAKARAEGVVVPADLPEAAPDTKPILDRLAEVGTVNAGIEAEKDRRRRKGEAHRAFVQTAARLRAEAVEHRRQADVADGQAALDEAEAAGIKQEIDAFGALADPPDPGAIRAELAAAELVKAGIEARSLRALRLSEHKNLEDAIEGLTAAVDAREAEIETAIRGAAMPVPGLGFGENFVSLNGLPFDQASAAEQLRVSVAIAMAANPELRVIRIMDGSLLDDDGVKWLASVAAEADYQVWVERVDSSGKVGITINDGQVAAIEGVEQPPAIPKLL